MKRLFLLAAAVLVMGGAMAQTGRGMKEYVSVLVTFTTSNVPQDSLDKYGVILQERVGLTARGLVDAEKYQAFMASDLVERVQPSTRVLLPSGSEMTEHKCSGGHHAGKCSGEHHDGDHHAGNCDRAKANDKPEIVRFKEACKPEHNDRCEYHPGQPRPHRPVVRGNVRQYLLDEQEIANEDARGWYVGVLLGGSRSGVRVDKAPFEADWLTDQGINFEARAGYNFNQWFGIRSGLQLLSKNYAYVTPLTDTTEVVTRNVNMYLQLPLMADFSFGNEVVRVHVMFGGYAGWWCTEYRDGYVYNPQGTSGLGYSYNFAEGYDQRFDAGLVGGAELSLRITPKWQLHFGGDYFYGLVNCKKDPYKSFNKTSTFEMGLTYHF